MEMSIAEKLTYSTVLIRCKYSDGTSGSGTGFIVNLCQDEEKHICVPVIITNNHVVKDSIETRFEFCMADESGNPIDNKCFNIQYLGNAWIHHPDKSVDLCCLLLAEILKDLEKNGIKIFYIPLQTNLIPPNADIETLSAMEDVVMVGYPIGLSDSYNHKPIIRKGITATHIKKDYQGKKEFLIDMACFPGSSGSPIFILNEGSYHIGTTLYAGSRVGFIGILYGGPKYTTKGELILMDLPNRPRPIIQIPTNLGIAIKAQRILEFETIFVPKMQQEFEKLNEVKDND